MLKKILGLGRPKSPALGDTLSYEEAREALEANAGELHRALAKRADAPPEVLYYLAENPDAEIRALVAGNPATPQKANLLLSEDRVDEVRCELARKIARLLPELSSEEQEKLSDGTIEVIERLASDHLPRVRQILAEELKASAKVPRAIVLKLAHDLESIVCVPIIEYSPLLSDGDLLEIIATSKASGALEAVARRADVSEDVADAVVATLDIPAVAALLANPSAHIREQALDAIIENAASIEAWHSPLVMRPDLSVRAIKRIASFVASSLVNLLSERHGIDEATARELKSRVRGRLETEGASPQSLEDDRRAEAAVHQAAADGRLDDSFLETAIEAGQREQVVLALAHLATLTPMLVRRILASRNGKAVAALTWKAGLSMRTALTIQARIAQVPRQAMILARDGVHYPLSSDELQWHLDYFTGVQQRRD